MSLTKDSPTSRQYLKEKKDVLEAAELGLIRPGPGVKWSDVLYARKPLSSLVLVVPKILNSSQHIFV